MFVSDVIKTRVWWPIAANQKKIQKQKIFYSEKKSPKLSWPKKNKKMKK